MAKKQNTGIGQGRYVAGPKTWTDAIHGMGPYDPLGYLPTWAAPPPGTFSPGIAYDVQRSRSGLGELIEDQEKQVKRAGVDAAQKNRETRRNLGYQLGDYGRERGYAQTDEEHELEDLGTGHQRRLGGLGINFARTIQDLSTSRMRGQEDYDRTLTDLQHRYGSLAQQQNEAFVGQGTNEGGTEAASQAVRGANQTYDKSGVDLSHTRTEQDLGTRQGRAEEDYARQVGQEEGDFGTNQGRISEGLGRRLSALAVNENRARTGATSSMSNVDRALGRTQVDANTAISRGKANQSGYEQAQTEAAYFEAHQLHPKIQFPAGAAPGAAPHVPPMPHYGSQPSGHLTTPMSASAFAHPAKFRRAGLGY